MAELVEILEGLNCRNVRTYIQSGNAVFQNQSKQISRLAARISQAINKRHGFQPEVFLLDAEKLRRVISSNPFPEAESEPKSLHVNFLEAKPAKSGLAKLDGLRKQNERIALDKDVLYLHAPDGIGRSKLAASAERLLGVRMTGRNWRTVCKIEKMVECLS